MFVVRTGFISCKPSESRWTVTVTKCEVRTNRKHRKLTCRFGARRLTLYSNACYKFSHTLHKPWLQSCCSCESVQEPHGKIIMSVECNLLLPKSTQDELTRLVVRTSDYVFQQRGGFVVTNRPQKRVFQKKLALEAPGEGHCGPHCRPYCRW